MSRRTRAQKNRAARARQAIGTVPAETNSPEPAAHEPVTTISEPRGKPVRVTVPLQSDEYIALKRFAVEVMESERLPLVAGAEVIRVLLTLMRDDPDLAQRVRARLAATGGNRRR